MAYHGYQNFQTGEATHEEAHKIGLKTARRMWKNEYEIVVTTHLNTDNVHNHFVVNSVSFKTGRKFENHNSDHYRLREISAKIKPLRNELSTAKAVLEKIPRFKELLETERQAETAVITKNKERRYAR